MTADGAEHPVSPTVAAWELATRLRARRLALGVDVETITRELGFSRPYWSAIENARTQPAEAKLQALIGVLGFDQVEAGELLALRKAARRRGWWADRVPENLKRFVGLEQGAVAERTYEALIVTGLLQTNDYVRALASSSPFVKSVDIEAVVSLRMRRQERLVEPEPLRLTSVMSQSALLQHVGERSVLLGQLRHLVEVIDRHPSTIEVRIVPFEHWSAGVVSASTLYLLEFASQHLPTVAWSELAYLGLLMDDPDEVRPLVISFEQALDVALTREESLDLIESCARKLERTI